MIFRFQNKKKEIKVTEAKFRLLFNVILVLIASCTFLLSFTKAIPSFAFYYIIGGASFLFTFSVLRMLTSKSIFYDKQGISLPASWLRRKFLPWNEIVKIEFLKFQGLQEKKVNGVYLTVDTNWTRLVTTGLEPPGISIIEGVYNLENYREIEQDFNHFNSRYPKTANTLNERVRRQVSIAWNKRRLRMLQNIIIKFEWLAFAIIILELIVFSVTGFLIVLGSFLFGTLFIFFLVLEYSNLPYSTVVFRPHELGPIAYNPDEVVTNIRFIVMTQPYQIELLECEIIHDNLKQFPQVSDFIQIHPKKIAPGELTHGNAQISGNHTKSLGIYVHFKIKERKFKLPIYWND